MCGIANLARVPIAIEVKVRDLPKSVDPGICSSGPLKARRFLRKFLKRCFDRFLHGRPIGLSLPPDKGRPIVFDRDPITCHGV